MTPKGVLYDRGAAIEYILARKKEIEAATKAYDAQEAVEATEAAQRSSGDAQQRRQSKKRENRETRWLKGEAVPSLSALSSRGPQP